MSGTISEITGLKMGLPVFKSKLPPAPCTAPELLAGVEIETEQVNRNAAEYEDRLGKLWSVKTDGSLRGAAYEFVSRPTAIKSLIPELELFYKTTGFTEGNYTDRCSVHVHTNVLDMTPDQLGSLCLVYSIMEEVLFHFVNTHNVGERQPSRDTNLYCVPWSQCRMNYAVVTKLFTDDFGLRNWQKYTALNLKPVREQGTVEWRHMHGTADPEKLALWLDMIGSLVTYAKTTELNTLIDNVKSLNNTSLYQQFYEATLGRALPYKEEYSGYLYQGVINAKYSMIGYGSSDKKLKIKEPREVALQDAVRELQDIANRVGMPQPLPVQDWVPQRPEPPVLAEGFAVNPARGLRPQRVRVAPREILEGPPNNPFARFEDEFARAAGRWQLGDDELNRLINVADDEGDR